MKKFLLEFNKDQLTGLAEMSFSLAKAAFIFIFVPTTEGNLELLKIIFSAITGLAFTGIALVLLKVKERIKK